MLDCDVLLILGTDFPHRQFYPRGAEMRIAQVEVWPEQIGRRAPVDLGVVGDVRATLETLVPLIKGKRTGFKNPNFVEDPADVEDSIADASGVHKIGGRSTCEGHQ
jgi:thiamine pyrophosphate-dependent acetolactate synthase large subunit-like protein